MHCKFQPGYGETCCERGKNENPGSVNDTRACPREKSKVSDRSHLLCAQPLGKGQVVERVAKQPR